MKSIEKFQVYYISGYGRSGSTLLDITLGNHAQYQSLGELTNFINHGILNKEYCSCGVPVNECKFWSNIYQDWTEIKAISDSEYLDLKHKFIRNKASLKLLRNYYFPSKEFKLFCNETSNIYQLISKSVPDKILVDSSKSAQTILILKFIKIPFKVIHLKRNFVGVLNSSRKEMKKDFKGGVERDFSPIKWSYVLITWLIDNLLTKIFSVGVKRHRVQYEKFVNNPIRTIEPIVKYNKEFESLLLNKGPFISPHLVAGNKLRMKGEIMIASKPLNDATQLNKFEIRLAKLVDLIF